MIASQATPQVFLRSINGALPQPIPAEVLYREVHGKIHEVHEEPDERRSPAQTLADLYRRCSPSGGRPYTLDQLIRVLQALQSQGAVVATQIAGNAALPASAIYGCVLELEDYCFVRWIPEPVLRADHITAEITEAGLRFLREITIGGRY